MVYSHRLIFTWQPALSFFILAFILIRTLPYFNPKTLKRMLFFFPEKYFMNTVFLNDNYELTSLDNIHIRISICICHFFDTDNVIIELEQIRGHNQNIGKISPWSGCLTAYTPHVVQNAIHVKSKATEVQLVSTSTAKR